MISETLLEELIKEYCRKAKKPYKLTTYGMKAIFEALSQDYIREDVFIKILLKKGYKVNGDNKVWATIKPSDRINAIFWFGGNNYGRNQRKKKSAKGHE